MYLILPSLSTPNPPAPLAVFSLISLICLSTGRSKYTNTNCAMADLFLTSKGFSPWLIKSTLISPVYPGSIVSGEFYTLMPCAKARLDLGRTGASTSAGIHMTTPVSNNFICPGRIVISPVALEEISNLTSVSCCLVRFAPPRGDLKTPVHDA